MGRCLLIDAKFPKKYWVRALAMATVIRNRTVGSSTFNKTPHELYKGKAPKMTTLKVFGCSAFVLKRKSKARKLDPKSTKAKFLGFWVLMTKARHSYSKNLTVER